VPCFVFTFWVVDFLFFRGDGAGHVVVPGGSSSSLSSSSSDPQQSSALTRSLLFTFFPLSTPLGLGLPLPTESTLFARIIPARELDVGGVNSPLSVPCLGSVGTSRFEVELLAPLDREIFDVDKRGAEVGGVAMPWRKAARGRCPLRFEDEVSIHLVGSGR
jgi:hypothetical protein